MFIARTSDKHSRRVNHDKRRFPHALNSQRLSFHFFLQMIKARFNFNSKIQHTRATYLRGLPSLVKGVGLRRLSCRGSWVQIPPPALSSSYVTATNVRKASHAYASVSESIVLGSAKLLVIHCLMSSLVRRKVSVFSSSLPSASEGSLNPWRR